MRRLLLLGGVLASCAALACAEYCAPLYAQPEIWRTWFAEVEACSGISGDFDAIEWSVREEPEQAGPDRLTVGHWDGDRGIWLARHFLDDEGAVKHEILHFLLQRSGHFAPPFGICTEGT